MPLPDEAKSLQAAMRFDAVDDQQSTDHLVRSMVAADEHTAVQVLRDWSADQLRITDGATVVELGCGPGTAAADLASRVGTTGRVIGIDSSEAMIDTARAAYESVPVVAFVVGDALSLDLADDAVDGYRSERTFQHLSAPETALAEALRVVRPGGRVAVIDTDWGTLAVDHPDRMLTERLSGAPRRFPLNSWSGRRLYSQMRRVGLVDLGVRVESLVATSWDPDTSPGVEGLPPFAMVAQSAQSMGVFDGDEAARWLAALEDEARAGRFFLMLSMVAVVGTVPS